jgi:hypothetical protein
MPIKTLKGLKKEQLRQSLIDNNFQVVRHRYNYLKLETLFQVAMNRISRREGIPVTKVFHLLTISIRSFQNTPRVNVNPNKYEIIDEKMVCLSHGNPDDLHPPLVLSSCSAQDVKYTKDNTNVVANQVSMSLCPHCDKAIQYDKDIQGSYHTADIVEDTDWW